MTKQLQTLLNFPFLRNILLAFLLVALLIPIYEHFRAFPPFRNLLTSAAEDQALRIATHLSSYDFFKNSPLDSIESIPEAWVQEVSMVSRDLKLEKVKVFSKAGAVIFSTNSDDVGKINKHDYYHNIVAEGEIFTKVVEKDGKSLEGRILRKTVVETYVPIMRDNGFAGSFEIYYDIATQRSALDALLKRFNLDMVIMGIGLSLLSLVLVSRAGREMQGRESAQESLRLSEEKFRSVNEATTDAIIMIDAQGKITMWNPAAQQMFDYSQSEALGSDMHQMLAPERFLDSANKGFARFSQTGQGGKLVGKTVEMVALRKGGSEFPVEVSVNSIQFHGEWHAVGILRDITARKEAEQRFKLGLRVMENAADAIVVTNSRGVIEMINPAFTTVTGFNVKESIGKTPRILSSGRHDKVFYQDMWATIAKDGVWRGEIWNRRKDGAIYPQQLSMSAIYDMDHKVSHYVGVFNDISQRKSDEENLERLAFYDPLTGAPNRLLFRERLEQAIKEDRRDTSASALLFLDLDRFKQVNDTYGHEVGDLLLQEATRRMQNLVRDNDTVSRLGGDEFTIILRHASNPVDGKMVSGKIIDAMTKPFKFGDVECSIGASIGIAFYPQHAEDMETLIKRADIAMYVAKNGGRNRFHIYES